MLPVDFVKAMPKVELHVHLEGAIMPATLLEMADKYGVRLPFRDTVELRSYLDFRDLEHFLQVYSLVANCLRSPDDFARVTYELAAEAARQNVLYLEVTFSPLPRWRRQSLRFEDLLAGVSEGRKAASAKLGIEMQWVVDHPRDYGIAAAMQTARWAVAARDTGVVALGLGGPEQPYPPSLFGAAFEYAAQAGLGSVPHAGETAGAESIWSAIHSLRASRIQHGLRAVDDPQLVEYLREHQIALSICPTSNVRTKAVSSLTSHPLRKLYEAGVPITIDTDDPTLFGTTVVDEYLLLLTHFDFSLQDLEQVSLNGVSASFLPTDRKRSMESAFRARFSQLEQHLAAPP